MSTIILVENSQESNTTAENSTNWLLDSNFVRDAKLPRRYDKSCYYVDRTHPYRGHLKRYHRNTHRCNSVKGECDCLIWRYDKEKERIFRAIERNPETFVIKASSAKKRDKVLRAVRYRDGDYRSLCHDINSTEEYLIFTNVKIKGSKHIKDYLEEYEKRNEMRKILMDSVTSKPDRRGRTTGQLGTKKKGSTMTKDNRETIDISIPEMRFEDAESSAKAYRTYYELMAELDLQPTGDTLQQAIDELNGKWRTELWKRGIGFEVMCYANVSVVVDEIDWPSAQEIKEQFLSDKLPIDLNSTGKNIGSLSDNFGEGETGQNKEGDTRLTLL